MAKFHHEFKFLDNVKDAAAEALEILNEYQELLEDIDRHERDIEDAERNLERGKIGQGHEEDLESAKKYLAESLADLEALEEKRVEAFRWFYSVSGVNLED